MDKKYIESIQQGWMSIHEKKKKLDPVDDKELKGDHDDRDDKDIDNDGDADSSDEYLHKKRKAIKKSMDQEESCGKKKMKESVKVRHEALGFGEIISEEDGKLDVLFDTGVETVHTDDVFFIENKQTKGASKPEGIMDKESPKSKKFAKDHEGGVADDAEIGHDLVSKAAAGGTKQAPNRGNDNRKGDLKPVKVKEDLDESAEIQKQIDALQKRKVQTGGHGRRAKIQAQIDVLKKKLKESVELEEGMKWIDTSTISKFHQQARLMNTVMGKHKRAFLGNMSGSKLRKPAQDGFKKVERLTKELETTLRNLWNNADVHNREVNNAKKSDSKKSSGSSKPNPNPRTTMDWDDYDTM